MSTRAEFSVGSVGRKLNAVTIRAVFGSIFGMSNWPTHRLHAVS